MKERMIVMIRHRILGIVGRIRRLFHRHDYELFVEKRSGYTIVHKPLWGYRIDGFGVRCKKCGHRLFMQTEDTYVADFSCLPLSTQNGQYIREYEFISRGTENH